MCLTSRQTKDMEEGKKEPKTKTFQEMTEGKEQMNNNKPIWLRMPSEVTE